MSDPAPLPYDAVILAGGRSSRLGGTAKAGLTIGGRTLLEGTRAAVPDAQLTVIVGPADPVPEAGVIVTRESPPFAGPAAALCAGLASLAAEPDRDLPAWTFVLACDMPRCDVAVEVLLGAAAEDSSASVVALDQDRVQLLAGLYRREELFEAAAEALAAGGAQNLSMRALLARVKIRPVPVPPGTTSDVDTWADARILGVDVR